MKRIKIALNNPLIFGSAVMIIGSNAVNALNYLYHLVMGRMLGPAGYGELSVLLSLIGMFTMVPSFLSLVIVKFIASSKSDDEVKNLISWLNQKVILLAVGLGLLVVITAPLFSSFLHLTNINLILLTALISGISIVSVLYDSALQGLLRFKEMVLTALVSSCIKVLLGVVLVYMGFFVFGAISGLTIAFFLATVGGRFFVKDYLIKNLVKAPPLKSLFLYSFPVFLKSVSIISLVSIDLILVKHFFPSTEAGIYAALALLGKIIFFTVGPITNVMFPIVARRHSSGGSYIRVFYYSLFFTILLSSGVLLIYWLFPQWVISILFDSRYLGMSHLLIWFGLFNIFYSISVLYIDFQLSLNETKVVFLPVLAAVFQIVGIWFYHDSLLAVVAVSVSIMFVLCSSLIIYSLGFSKVRSSSKQKLLAEI